jgi:hypothetical protein
MDFLSADQSRPGPGAWPGIHSNQQTDLLAIFGASDQPVADLFSAGADPRHADLLALKGRLVQFASGLSRTNDFEPAAWAGHPVGVEIGEMSDHALRRLAQVIVDYQTPAFVDSGAFGVFMRGIRGSACKPLDFPQILASYDRLAEQISQQNPAEEAYPAPLYVMPDIVGDQLASLDLIVQHRRWIAATCAFPRIARAIVPIQLGPMAVADVYRRVTDTLGTDNFIVGVPSNAAAFSPSQFTQFLKDAKPRAVHILGAFADSRVTPRLNQILDSGIADDLMVSADANPLRSIIIARGQGAAGRRHALVSRLGDKARKEALIQYIERQGGIDVLKTRLHHCSPSDRVGIIGLLSDYSGLPTDLIARRLGFSNNFAERTAA